ncbi:polysaccharide biosynthesis protein [Qipengyuania aquimaris]|uniref:polysaccharide biosynthesis protein n=1 Tax=Qipengyuania aquimaris TaxID=255984 RepID=UPI001C94ED29|nr:nucleoside-diphosphate sugar epimerase/dehydratase [Qipengyuania aquimaris]MBY6128406.1 polysaccharide biosynthesis protein [Qipengyuania aquimaris]
MTDKVRSANDDWSAESVKTPSIRKVVGLGRAPSKVRPYRPASLRRLLRTTLLAVLDMTAFVVSLLVAAFMVPLAQMGLEVVNLPTLFEFAFAATATLFALRLYKHSWRFFGFRHAAAVVAFGLAGSAIGWTVILVSQGIALTLPVAVTAITQWMLATGLLLALRSARRLARESLSGSHIALGKATRTDLPQALLIGPAQWAMSVIELMRAEDEPQFAIAGILLPSEADVIDRIGGVRVLGSHDKLVDVAKAAEEQGRPFSIAITLDDGMYLGNREMTRLTHRARELGLELSRIKNHWSQILQRPGNGEVTELSVPDLLGRNEYELEGDVITRQIEGQSVLVTGAGGTIGGELARQLASFRPSRLILLELCEYNLYSIEMQLREAYPDLDIRPELCDIRSQEEVLRVFDDHRPSVVYHAAALKHVPIVELNPCAGVHTNIIGTKHVADAVTQFGARAMVQVSTDKAVNPVGMMGATKRVGELYSQALDMCGVDDPGAPRFMTVRFGNVLGSSGSILPLFRRQLEEGKPLTVTHPDIERFFMTVREAVQLILQSSAAALAEDLERGSIYVLDMGKPVRIVDLAYRLIAQYGLEPEVDVPIEFVGLRPGEKLYEELFDDCEEEVESRIKGIFEARSHPIPLPFINKSIDRLREAVIRGDPSEAERIAHHLVKIPSSGARFDLIPAKRGSERLGEAAPVTT